MTSILAFDQGVCVPPESTTDLSHPISLKQFVRDPLLYISRWYSGSAVHGYKGRNEEEEEGACQPTDETNQFHLHANAESCLSSLRAGTASIVLHQRGEGGVHFLNLPVSSLSTISL